jgi:hypothetical protein
MSVKMAVFWDVAPCTLVDIDSISGELTASIFRAMSKLHTKSWGIYKVFLNDMP